MANRPYVAYRRSTNVRSNAEREWAICERPYVQVAWNRNVNLPSGDQEATSCRAMKT